DIERLRTNPSLLQLLSHYVRLAQPDREAWQDRLAAMDGGEPAETTKLHGELLAFGWIEWTSCQSGRKSSACYRVTSDGLRAIRIAADQNSSDQALPAAIDDSAFAAFRQKRKKKPTAEAVSIAD